MAKVKITFSSVKKIIWGFFLLIFVFIIAIALWLAVDKFILKSPVPSVFGFASLTVETGSMQGTIDAGDMVIIKDKDEYRVGDIITYLHEGDTIPTTHRIINYNPDGSFVTRGDANNARDPEAVTKDIIIGKVVKVIPNAGIFAAWLKAEGWIYAVACLVILTLGFYVISTNDDKTEEDEN